MLWFDSSLLEWLIARYIDKTFGTAIVSIGLAYTVFIVAATAVVVQLISKRRT